MGQQMMRIFLMAMRSMGTENSKMNIKRDKKSQTNRKHS
jgi:hypothetical protein